MHTSSAVANTYFQTQVRSRSSIELVVMLYDGATKFLGQARDAAAQRDTEAAQESISRSLAIIAELQNTLNMDAGGELAETLDALYVFIRERLLDASLRGDRTAIDDSLRVLAPLREAWAEIATRGPGVSEVR